MADYDCQACGACCAYDAEWPTLGPGDDGPDGPPPELVEDGHMRWIGSRCIALEGIVGACVRCAIYTRRPTACRGCEPGSVSCHAARTLHGLPIDAVSTMDDLLP